MDLFGIIRKLVRDVKDLNKKICCLTNSEGINMQTLSVGPMMELIDTGSYTPENPFLRVRDSGKVTMLDYSNGGYNISVVGRRYGRCVTIWLSIQASDPEVSTWDEWIYFPNGWTLGRPDFSVEEIRHFESTDGTPPTMVEAGLAIWRLNNLEIAPAMMGYSGLVTPIRAAMTFSYTTSDAWPEGIPTDATGATIPNPDPDPIVPMVITLDDIGSPTTLGVDVTFTASVNQTPDEPLILHLQILGGDSVDYVMTDAGGGDWSFGPWTSYYQPYPGFWDVYEGTNMLSYYVSGKFNGIAYNSDTLVSEGV